ncbi:MAG TPA: hypothetical protein VGM98_06355 [Schlesneria sp.]|jgi:hypothetical protein
MREFFRGWRRKAGSILLLMALVACGAWIRNRLMIDTFEYLPEAGPRHSLTLSPQGIRWLKFNGSGQSIAPTFLCFAWDATQYSPSEVPDSTDGWSAVWNWQGAGFQFAFFQLQHQSASSDGHGLSLVSAEIGVWQFPFWSVAFPLTAMSAYLILWHPQKGVAHVTQP